MTAQLLPVRMPQLSGGRERAQELTAPIMKKMAGQIVRLDCRQLVAGTASFADELIVRVLEQGCAQQLVIEYASGEFAEYLRSAARDHNASERILFI